MGNLKTTEELLEDVLNYTNIIDVYLYNDPSESIEAIKMGSSQLRELMTRDDYKEVIIREYKEYKFKEDFSTNEFVFETLKDTKELAKIYLLECIMTSEEFIKDFTEVEQRELNQTVYDKYLEKVESSLYADMEDSIYEFAIKSNTSKEYCVTVKRGGSATVVTPKGSLVDVIINNYFGDRWANAITMQFKKDYPNIEVIAKSDNRYNCHSYAWYKADPTNTYWINDPMPYMFDGSYNMTKDILPDNKVTWVEIEDEEVSYVEHSGIVNRIENKKVMVTSKWGQGPLVIHEITDSPYTSRNVLYFTNKF